MKYMKKNKMLIHIFVLVTFFSTARSAEAEIMMEAAFQGHCGHTSPCEQLCYEIHDGMYECDCIEGYELNKNGYSCQVINSTIPSKSDEDVLYQKGASFSAKLIGTGSTSSALYESIEGNEDDATNYYIEKTPVYRSSTFLNTNITSEKVNSNSDYYISAESINFTNSNINNNDDNDNNSDDNNNDDIEFIAQRQDVPDFFFNSMQTANNIKSTTNMLLKNKTSITNFETIKNNVNTIYDDINNNQLEFHPLDNNQIIEKEELNIIKLPSTSINTTTTTTTTSTTTNNLLQKNR